jgi:hypothetical protein
MSTENNAAPEAATDVTVDLDTFSDELFGRSPAPEEATPEDVTEGPTEDDASHEDTQPEADTLDNEDEPDLEEEAEKPAPKKSRFQERIDELTAGRREAERKAAELETRLAQLEAAKQDTKPTPAPEPVSEGPDPYAKNEDGTDVYALGEYDPAYLRDFTKHLLAEERAQAKAQEAEAAKTTQYEAERIALQESWESKLPTAQERYPDFIEKGDEFVQSFSDLDPAYGEYLTAQIMDLDYGTDVLYYLASHPDEARAIVESGARKATVALGRLDARFSFTEEEKQKVLPKVSKAPTPPPTNRGSAVVADVADDTDDLDAFERKLFKRR